MSSSKALSIRARDLTKLFSVNPYGYRHRTLREEMLRTFSPKRRRMPDEGKHLKALDNVSFDVSPGEIIGVVGRNGSGKSTLLRIVAKITRPSFGYVEVYGSVGTLLEIGTGFHTELTGRENVFLSGSILGMKDEFIRERFTEIVEYADVEDFIDIPIKRFSSGMRMRLAFSVAAHLQPDILLVDEVLSVGDHLFQKKSLGTMSELADTGRTVLFVSHNLKALKSLCSRIIVLEAGKIVQDSNNIEAAIEYYLKSQEAWATYGQWIHTNPDPGNPWYNPARMALVDEWGHVMTSPIAQDGGKKYIEIEFDMFSELENFALGIAIYDSEGQLLFISMQYDDPFENMPELQLGRNIMRIELPVSLLNHGRYRVEWISQILPDRWVHAPNRQQPGILIEVNDISPTGKGIFTTRQGLFAPSLRWHKLR